MLQFNLNYRLREKMLGEPIVGFSDAEIERKRTKSLEELADYYDKVLEAICGPEIHQLLELRAKVDNVLAVRKAKAREKRNRKYEG